MLKSARAYLHSEELCWFFEGSSILKAFQPKSWLIDWIVFYAAFNSISFMSRPQLTLFMLSWVSPVLGWALKCLAQGHSHEKTQRIQCGSNPVKHSTTGPRWSSQVLEHGYEWQKLIDWLISLYVLSTLFRIYLSGNCAPNFVFSGVPLTSILSKPLAASSHNTHWNNAQKWAKPGVESATD